MLDVALRKPLEKFPSSESSWPVAITPGCNHLCDPAAFSTSAGRIRPGSDRGNRNSLAERAAGRLKRRLRLMKTLLFKGGGEDNPWQGIYLSRVKLRLGQATRPLSGTPGTLLFPLPPNRMHQGDRCSLQPPTRCHLPHLPPPSPSCLRNLELNTSRKHEFMWLK